MASDSDGLSAKGAGGVHFVPEFDAFHGVRAGTATFLQQLDRTMLPDGVKPWK
jgi:hypothetical protein